jgi:RimJ/RimL family protein N-acetyltransferase
MSVDNRLVFLKSRNVTLKVLETQDLNESNWIGWFNDKERCANNRHHKFPNTWENQSRYLNSSDETKIQLGVFGLEVSSSICGVISLQEIDYLNGTAHIGIMLDKVTEKKPEIFVESFSLMLAHGFEELRLSKICVGSLDERLNPSLEKLFNFRNEGTLRRHVFKNGKYRDVHLGAVFADEVQYRHER